MTGYKDVHPITSFLFFLIVFVVSMTATHPVLLGISLVSSLVCAVRFTGKKALRYFFGFIFPAGLLITVINAFFNHYGVTVLFVMKNGNNFTLESLVYGLVFAVRVSCVLLWLESFNVIVSSDKLIFLFGRLSPRLALLISMVLRFIPLMKQESQEIEMARQGVGTDSKTGKYQKRLKMALHRISILITRALECSVDSSDSMLARGYGLPGRTSYNNYVFSKRDKVLSAFSILSAGALIFESGEFSAVYNPIIEINSLNLLSVIIALCFAILCFEPLIIDVWEEKLWLHSKPKI